MIGRWILIGCLINLVWLPTSASSADTDKMLPRGIVSYALEIAKIGNIADTKAIRNIFRDTGAKFKRAWTWPTKTYILNTEKNEHQQLESVKIEVLPYLFVTEHPWPSRVKVSLFGNISPRDIEELQDGIKDLRDEWKYLDTPVLHGISVRDNSNHFQHITIIWPVDPKIENHDNTSSSFITLTEFWH